MPRFVFSGTFCALNKGDAAMQLSADQLLRDQFEGADITILSSYPEIDRETYGEIALCQSDRRRPATAFARLGAAMVWALINRLFGIDAGFLIRANELQEIRHCDALIDLSGDTLTEDYGIRCVISHLMPIMMAITLGRPVVVCAQTIGPFAITRPMARFALNRASIITAREQLSFDYLSEIGVAQTLLRRTNDVAFLLKSASAERVAAILLEEAILENGRPLVGLTISRLIGHRFSPTDAGRFAALMASVADRLIEEFDVDVILLSHVTGPGEKFDDRIMATAVYENMNRAGNAFVMKGDYTPGELKGLIGRLDMFVGVRMHANISALAMRVPTLAIAYSRKTHGIMQASGQERWVVDIATLSRDNLFSAAAALWRERQDVRQDLIACMPAVEELAKENAQHIRNALAQR